MRAILLTVLFLVPAGAAAQQRSRPKIGLALSGGGARGAAHIGVLKALEREGIPIDYVAGTSSGALVGGLYALGYTPAEIETLFESQDWNNLFASAPERILSPLLLRGDNSRYQLHLSFEHFTPELPTGIIRWQPIINVLDTLTTRRMMSAGYDFDRTPVPFRAVATNLLTGDRYVFRRGSMTEALRASMAIPILFSPVRKDGLLLVDGGLTDNMPADVVRDMGADFVIAVDASSPLLKGNEIRNLSEVVDQTINIIIRQHTEDTLRLIDVVIRPDLGSYTTNSYNEVADIIKRGELQAEHDMPSLKSRLGPVGPLPMRAPVPAQPLIIDSISFSGLARIPARQVIELIRSRAGAPADAEVLAGDVRRLYDTGLFTSVDFEMEPAGGNRYHAVYVVKEIPMRNLGASVRYDNEYNFVALVEFTWRRLFGTPSTAVFSSQFGGLQNHALTVRFMSESLPGPFIEPEINYLRLPRDDYRNLQLVDTFTDERAGGQLMIGGHILKALELEVGYRAERVRIEGGTPPNTQAGNRNLAGISFRLRRDTLAGNFPLSGTTVGLRIDQHSKTLGSDFTYSKWQAELARYFEVKPRATLGFSFSAGYTHGSLPFYERFYLGGYSFSSVGSRQFLGFSRDQLTANQMAVLRTEYRQTVFSHPLALARRGFLYGFYNAAAISNEQTSPYHFRIYTGAGIGFAVDSALGPLRFAAAYGSGGHVKLYVSLGPSF